MRMEPILIKQDVSKLDGFLCWPIDIYRMSDLSCVSVASPTPTPFWAQCILERFR